MRPIAGQKGLGLAMMVQCLAGSLAGAQASTAPPRRSGSAGGVDAFLLVIHPDLFIGRQAFDASMNDWLQHCLRSGGSEARYPGQRQAQCERERRAFGIPVPDSVVAELQATGDATGRRFDLRPL
jgi:LDH2 family malate/lactate/ureidoglycolate dehydrogenase